MHIELLGLHQLQTTRPNFPTFDGPSKFAQQHFQAVQMCRSKSKLHLQISSMEQSNPGHAKESKRDPFTLKGHVGWLRAFLPQPNQPQIPNPIKMN